MTGLEERLRRVEGVADLTVDLDEEGLRGIRVRIGEGSDEGEVLEEIRRILVAYGLRSRHSSLRSEPVRELEPDQVGGEAPSEPSAAALPLSVSVGPVEDGLEVVLAAGARRVVGTGDASPLGAVEAMARAVAAWRDLPVPDRLALRRLTVDEAAVLLVVAHLGGVAGAGASVVSGSVGEALHRAVSSAMLAVA